MVPFEPVVLPNNAAVLAAVKDGSGETLDAARAMLAAGEIDAFATNKATLFEMGDKVAGSRVLDASWGKERMALALPKGRAAAVSYASGFVEAAKAEGVMKSAIERAGLRGAIAAPASDPGHPTR